MHTKIDIKRKKHLYKKNRNTKVDRESFIGMKLRDRRKLLTEQADKLAQYYLSSTDWKEFQALDVLEDD